MITKAEKREIYERVFATFIGEIWHCETYEIVPEENYIYAEESSEEV